MRVRRGRKARFQDTGTPYTVRCVGDNHNLADVKSANNLSLVIASSAWLITVATGGSTGPRGLGARRRGSQAGRHHGELGGRGQWQRSAVYADFG